jgi:nitrile hydratase
MSYYEIWLTGLIELMIGKGLVTRAEIACGRPAPASSKATPALRAEAVASLTAKGSPYNRDVPVKARFQPGQIVRARNMNPLGHTRLPRYVRAKSGTVVATRGVFVFPDTNAHFKGENPQYLYSVRFAARELWGEQAAPQDCVHVDLWDDYLEPA